MPTKRNSITKKGKHVLSFGGDGIGNRLVSRERHSVAGEGNPTARGPPGIQRRLRYADLVERGIVRNRVTLANWINKQDFPPGQLTGPNCRTWGERDVQAWLDSRPVEPKPTPQPKRRPGRPRKAARAERATATATIKKPPGGNPGGAFVFPSPARSGKTNMDARVNRKPQHTVNASRMGAALRRRAHTVGSSCTR